MAGQHFTQASQPHLMAWFATLNQSQTMSHAKFVFLIALVIFFIALFVVAYVLMRRPNFGQKSGHGATTTSRTPGEPDGRAAHDAGAPGEETLPTGPTMFIS